MADGDYTIPTYPGVVGLNNGYGNDCGIEGKDAVLVHSLTDGEGKRHLTADVHRNSKENALLTLENKFQSATDQRDHERRTEKTMREMGNLMRDESEKTRDLIRATDELRRRDLRDAAVDAALAAINAKLQILLP